MGVASRTASSACLIGSPESTLLLLVGNSRLVRVFFRVLSSSPEHNYMMTVGHGGTRPGHLIQTGISSEGLCHLANELWA